MNPAPLQRGHSRVDFLSLGILALLVLPWGSARACVLLEDVCDPVESEETVVGVHGLGLSVAAADPAADPAAVAVAWLTEFAAAYESGDAVAYASYLATDFRFEFGDADLAARWPDGFDRAAELSSYARLFHGGLAADGMVLPPARRIDVEWEGIEVLPDPDPPAGGASHMFVLVRRARLAIEFADGTMARDEAPHAFGLVLVAGDDGVTGWRCRRWVERPRLDTLVSAAPGGPDAPIERAPRWTAFPNPLRAGAALSYVYEVGDADALVDVTLVDVAGRAVATLVRGPRPPGRHLARWDGTNGAGARVAAGVYFLRARVGERVARTRVIVVP